MNVAIVLVVCGAIAAPHALRLESAHPSTAAIIWLSAICLRALVALFAALYVIFYLPATELFAMVTDWCWHTLPFDAAHLGLSGHRVGDLALLAPLLGLVASLLWVCLGLWRAARAINVWVRRTAIGQGPQQSLIVGEHDIVIAAAGLRRPHVIVSAGALTTLDDDELAASLAHEHGHIARRHRFALLGAEIARALSRYLPGTRRAISELAFHLERDADRWALRQRHDPTALASAICKATRPCTHPHGAWLSLSGRGVLPRVRQLLVSSGAAPARRPGLDALAAGMGVLVIALAAALPAAAVAGAVRASHSSHASIEHHCEH